MGEVIEIGNEVKPEKVTAIMCDEGMFIGIDAEVAGKAVALHEAIFVQGSGGFKVGTVVVRFPKVVMDLDTKSPLFQAYFQTTSGITLK